MAKYYFDAHDGIEVSDAVGVELPELEAARLHAMQVASTITVKPGMVAEGGGAVVVTVRTNEEGTVLSVRLAFSIETV